jgi:hypothetical protein
LATPPAIRGIPVSQDEVAELDELRALLKPEQSLTAIDQFSAWLFATVAVVGTIGTALGATGVSDLHGRGRSLYAWAVVSLGISLAFATFARIPQLSRFNRYSALSMRRQLNRILLIRATLLVLAGIAFAVALGLAAFAPLESARSSEEPSLSMTYTLDEKGVIKARFAVARSRPLSAVVSELRTFPRRPEVPRPRGRVMTNADGAGAVELVLRDSNRYRRIVFFGRWRDKKGNPLVARVTIPVRERTPRTQKTQ